MKIYCFKRTF